MPSRNTIAEPRMAASIVHRWAGSPVHRQCRRRGGGVHRGAVRGPAAPRPCSMLRRARSRGPRRRRGVPARDGRVRRGPARRRPAAPVRASRSCRRRPGRTAGEVFQRWAAMGVEHFTSLGAEVEPVLVRDRGEGRRRRPRPGDRRGRPDLPVGRQARLPRRGSCAGRRSGAALAGAHERGAVVAGLLGRGDGIVWPDDGLRTCRSCGCRSLAAPLAGRARRSSTASSVLPHYDAWPEPFAALLVLQAPRGGGRARDRRGDGGRRPRRRVAGPRPRAGDGLARPPPRAVPRGRGVPALGAGAPRRSGAPAAWP